MRRLIATLLCVACLMCATTAVASADRGDWGIDVSSKGKQEVAAELARKARQQTTANKQADSAAKAPSSPTASAGKGQTWTKAQIEKYRAQQRAFAAALAVCQNELDLYGGAGMTAADCVAKAGPEPQPPAGEPDPKAEAPPPPDPAVLARIAVTRLRIPDPAVKIGPPPEINQWKRAFVGYPLWLWNSEADELTQSVTLDGVTLTLTARRQLTRFDMGEPGAAPVYCQSGTPWTRAVAPGAASPTCGYRYTQPSITKASPRGTYTVTATSRWNVTWTALGQSGVIPLQATASSQLPVGELQTVRRR